MTATHHDESRKDADAGQIRELTDREDAGEERGGDAGDPGHPLGGHVAVDLGERGWHSPLRLIENRTRVTPSRKVSITVMMESTAKTGMMLAMTGSPTLVKYAYELAQHQAELVRVT
jgi:hypothetical protein